MGIPKGITLIVGGGYHGKSTLLNALEVGIYDENGIDVISDRISGHFAWFREIELAFALNRLKTFDVIQKKNRQ